MIDEQKLIAELAARFMVEAIKKTGPTRDVAYSEQCVSHAIRIVRRASATPPAEGGA